jgi:hypothetical protein
VTLFEQAEINGEAGSPQMLQVMSSCPDIPGTAGQARKDRRQTGSVIRTDSAGVHFLCKYFWLWNLFMLVIGIILPTHLFRSIQSITR